MNSKDILNKVQKHTPSILGNERFTKSSVLLPLIRKYDDIYILFEVRSYQLNRQPGEICFPGGRIDKTDTSEQAAAIRETTEELGIQESEITDVYPLDYLVSPSGMIVYSHVGWIDSLNNMNPNPQEVEEVFMVPLSFFMTTKPDVYHIDVKVKPQEGFPFDLITGGKDYDWRTGKIDEYFYVYEDKVIWGLTAKILSHFLELIRS
ncbi:NUDIX domain-containing protein [Salinibacillus kushneri]|uniref:NUDIX domain-containing protein n=1 Tax=Salinibacillus kushneri TaxID=237682 RepID=A0A1I0CGD0_9BACI|nr:CoA pyrophosphatase [Salinibacillus kushneri]SET18472.1 NUDIX domain-containing protein [Salinibacillus kushneri]